VSNAESRQQAHEAGYFRLTRRETVRALVWKDRVIEQHKGRAANVVSEVERLLQNGEETINCYWVLDALLEHHALNGQEQV